MPGLLRNAGIQFARGKYIAFLDSDDLLTKTALEELSTLAEEYQADVVHTPGGFVFWKGKYLPIDDPAMTNMNELTDPKNFSFRALTVHDSPFPTEPTFEPENLAERVKLWINYNYDRRTWTAFVKRDFLVSNQIHFSTMKTAEDNPFNFERLVRAKKYLSVPNVTHIIRVREESISQKDQNLAAYISKHTYDINEGCNEFERIMNSIDFFKINPEYNYAVIDWFVNRRISESLEIYSKIPAFYLNNFLKKEFSSVSVPLASYMLVALNHYFARVGALEAELNKLKSKE